MIENEWKEVLLDQLRREAQKELLDELIKWAEQNALDQTSYSDVCWDDGDIMFKKTDMSKQGDWSQEEWNKHISEFKPEYISFNELMEQLRAKTLGGKENV